MYKCTNLLNIQKLIYLDNSLHGEARCYLNHTTSARQLSTVRICLEEKIREENRGGMHLTSSLMTIKSSKSVLHGRIFRLSRKTVFKDDRIQIALFPAY